MKYTSRDSYKGVSFAGCIPEIRSTETPIKQIVYDPDKTFSLTAAIINTLAELENLPPQEIGPPFLYDSIDITIVEKELFTSKSTESPRGTVRSLSFRHLGYYIVLTETGLISFYELPHKDFQEISSTEK